MSENLNSNTADVEALESDLEQSLILIRQHFQEQKADLVLQYQQQYAQLALQHMQDSQAIVKQFLLQTNVTNPCETSSSRQCNISENDISHQNHIGTTVSFKTKEKLKEMIYSKHKMTKPENNGLASPQYDPYPRLYQRQSYGLDSLGADNELRKATSEPNLKIKGVHALRAKLIERQHKNRCSLHANSGSSTEDLNSSLNSRAAAFFAAPSLPDVSSQRIQNVARNNFAQATSLDAVHFSSTPALQRFFAPQASTHWMKGAGVCDQPPSCDFDPVRWALETEQKLPGTWFSPAFGQFNLLHSQIRDLEFRRKSLVREETDEDVRKECTVPTTASVSNGQEKGRCRTGIVYDSTMCRHQCTCGDNAKHVEHGGRIHGIWARLHETGLAEECEKIPSRKAPLDFLRICHASNYCTFFGVSPTACLKVDPAELPLKSFVQLPCGGIGVDSDTYFNDTFTPSAVRAAVGCAVELCAAIAQGRISNGFAIVRPPGHHAEPNQALGFCFFNNVAIAAKIMQQRMGGGAKCKIAIVDWDVHHGNGTQLIFEADPTVLYLSMHRHDDGNFFPGSGAAEETGRDEGLGFTVNIPWSGEMMGDPEYLAAWRCVVAPVLHQFRPDAVVVSCGFDAAQGHCNAVGGYHLSSWMFGWMTSALTLYADGRLALVLEGGYHLAAISDAAEACVRALLTAVTSSPAMMSSPPMTSSPPASAAEQGIPNASACATLARVAAVHRNHWPAMNADAALVSHRQWQSGQVNLISRLERLDVGNVVKSSPRSSVDEET